MSERLRLALVQFRVEAGNPDDNFARMEERMALAVAGKAKPDLLLLPEMWNTGYDLERIGQIADAGAARTRAFFSSFCREHRVNVLAGSVAEKRTDGGIANTVYIFDRQGREVASYSKIHLFRLMNEHLHLQAGDSPCRFDLQGLSMAAIICYDIRFPELARKLALEGARMLLVPAEWPHPRLHHWRTLLQARAIENQMYVVACNTVGESGGSSFFGHSMVVDPWGEVIAEAGEEETVLTVEIDLSLVAEVRSRIPVFEDRRPQHYS